PQPAAARRETARTGAERGPLAYRVGAVEVGVGEALPPPAPAVPLPGDQAQSTVAQAVSGVGADPKTRGAFGFGPVSGRHRTQIHTLGHDPLGGVLQHAHLSTDPTQPKDSARTTDPVVAHHVPVSTQIDDAPRLHFTSLRHRLGRFAVVEKDRASVTYRLPDRAEGRFVCAHRR